MDRFGIHLEPLNAMLYQVGAFVPRLAIALVVVLAGWLVAKTVRFAVTKALRAINFNVLAERAGLDNFLRQGGWPGDTCSLFGVLAYWLVIFAALLLAFNGMGLSYIADLLGRVVWFVPNLFVALLVLAFGSYFARFVGEAVSSYFRGAQLRDAMLLGQIARYAVMAFVILIALDQVKVGGDIVRESFLVILAGVVFALALAFGLAGKDWAAEQIERWWPRLPKDDNGIPKGSRSDERPPR
ncbi:mechanosensitive ion channel family protein [Variovorax paradoxus]|uniref:mechanosensitive ion channel family protein n=1 Tax=Variovorax paradoxus TaxID=34073 RepID=UPI003ECD03F7